MVTDVSGFSADFSQLVWLGLQKADKELSVCAQFLESQTEADYGKNLIELAEQDYGLIVAVSPLLADATQEMSQRYPGTQFVIVDGTSDSSLPNVHGITFRVDEVAFPAGYLAAAWAVLKDPADPQVGWVGGTQTPSTEIFVVAYENGVQYYNEQNGKSVRYSGLYVGDLEASDQGKIAGNSLIDNGADVILGIGGKTGNGGLAAAKERGKWGIGVDVDQYNTLPDEKDILLTSCMKRLDNAVYAVIGLAVGGGLDDGGVYVGTLQNGGVGLAPFHDTESEIPNSLQQEVSEIQQRIIEGTLSGGWSSNR